MPDTTDGVLHRQGGGKAKLLISREADTQISDPAEKILAGAVACLVQAYAGNGIGCPCTNKPAEAMIPIICRPQSPVVLQHEREVREQVDGVAVFRLGVDVNAQIGKICVTSGHAP